MPAIAERRVADGRWQMSNHGEVEMNARITQLVLIAGVLSGAVAVSGCVPIAAGAGVGAVAAHGSNKSVEKGSAVGGLAGAAVAL